MLSEIEHVALSIYEHNMKGQPVCFSVLMKVLPYDRNTLNICIDKLFDILMIDGEWEHIEGKGWMRCYTTSHAYDSYFEHLLAYANTL